MHTPFLLGHFGPNMWPVWVDEAQPVAWLNRLQDAPLFCNGDAWMSAGEIPFGKQSLYLGKSPQLIGNALSTLKIAWFKNSVLWQTTLFQKRKIQILIHV